MAALFSGKTEKTKTEPVERIPDKRNTAIKEKKRVARSNRFKSGRQSTNLTGLGGNTIAGGSSYG